MCHEYMVGKVPVPDDAATVLVHGSAQKLDSASSSLVAASSIERLLPHIKKSSNFNNIIGHSLSSMAYHIEINIRTLLLTRLRLGREEGWGR